MVIDIIIPTMILQSIALAFIYFDILFAMRAVRESEAGSRFAKRVVVIGLIILLAVILWAIFKSFQWLLSGVLY